MLSENDILIPFDWNGEKIDGGGYNLSFVFSHIKEMFSLPLSWKCLEKKIDISKMHNYDVKGNLAIRVIVPIQMVFSTDVPHNSGMSVGQLGNQIVDLLKSCCIKFSRMVYCNIMINLLKDNFLKDSFCVSGIISFHPTGETEKFYYNSGEFNGDWIILHALELKGISFSNSKNEVISLREYDVGVIRIELKIKLSGYLTHKESSWWWVKHMEKTFNKIHNLTFDSNICFGSSGFKDIITFLGA